MTFFVGRWCFWQHGPVELVKNSVQAFRHRPGSVPFADSEEAADCKHPFFQDSNCGGSHLGELGAHRGVVCSSGKHPGPGNLRDQDLGEANPGRAHFGVDSHTSGI